MSALHSFSNAYSYDVFISHANHDKPKFVDPLKKKLEELGLHIWYDSEQIEWGDSIKGKIEEGLKKCRFGIVVLSPNFLGREWTEKELSELLHRQNKSGQKLLLPLLYHMTINKMKKSHPELEDIHTYVVKPNEDVRNIVIRFAKVLIQALKSEMGRQETSSTQSPPSDKQSVSEVENVGMGTSTMQIITELRKHPNSTKMQLASTVGVLVVEKILATLMKEGKIRQIADQKGKRWEVIG